MASHSHEFFFRLLSTLWMFVLDEITIGSIWLSMLENKVKKKKKTEINMKSLCLSVSHSAAHGMHYTHKYSAHAVWSHFEIALK